MTIRAPAISMGAMSDLPTILPDALRVALIAVGGKLERELSVADEIQGVVQGLNTLPPASLAQAEREIYDTAGLYRRRVAAPWRLGPWFKTNLSDEDQLRTVPGLEYLFLFHRDGRLREAALRKMSGPIPSAFIFVALAWRLNDWNAQVRAAAADCAKRLFPLTRPEIIAAGALTLLRRDRRWGRWHEERLILDQLFARPDVSEQLADILATRSTGPSASILRQALRSGWMDAYLSQLAADAVQPAVRAVAVQALIEGSASWPNGWRWRWIDKSMGVKRAETVFETRGLTVKPDRTAQIEAGLRDRSAAVRNAAISGLIRYRDEVPECAQLAEPLLADRSRRVRERAEFLLRPR